LGNLNEAVENVLGMRPKEHKEYHPHVTLGRIRKQKWDEMPENPKIEEKVNFPMTVENVSVMESGGEEAEYILLEECNLL
jgi:2'-5' RNA ligase